MSLVNSLKEYRKFTTTNDQVANHNLQTMNMLIPSLKETLTALSEYERAKILAALFTNNSKQLRILFRPIVKNHPDKNKIMACLGSIMVNSQSTPTAYFSPSAQILFECLLPQDFDNVERWSESSRILRRALQMIPEDIFSISFKKKLAQFAIQDTARLNIIADLSDVKYVENLQPLVQGKFSGDIKLQDYLALLKTMQPNTSQYILLTKGLLQNVLPQNLKNSKELKKITKFYFDRDYEGAIECLLNLALENENLIGKEPLTTLAKTSKKLKDPELTKNESRRFFENRISQYHAGNALDFQSVNKVMTDLTSRSISDPDHLSFGLLSLTENQMDEKRINELKFDSSKYPELADLYMLSDDGGDKAPHHINQFASRNKGLMRSFSRNFRDEISLKSRHRSTVDTHYPVDGIEEGDIDYYSQAYKRGVWAGSLSGHCFKIIVILENYMEKNKGDPELEYDINCFIKAMIGSYVDRGYHGIHEMLDVFESKESRELFEKYGVNLDTTWDEDVLEKSIRDAQEYARINCFYSSIANLLPTAVDRNIDNDIILSNANDRVQDKENDSSSKNKKSRKSLIFSDTKNIQENSEIGTHTNPKKPKV